MITYNNLWLQVPFLHMRHDAYLVVWDGVKQKEQIVCNLAIQLLGYVVDLIASTVSVMWDEEPHEDQ